MRRAGLDPELRPHDVRHTWASWHYAIHKDLLLLKDEGAWSTVALVTRYAHKIDDGYAAAIRTFWQLRSVSDQAELMNSNKRKRKSLRGAHRATKQSLGG